MQRILRFVKVHIYDRRLLIIYSYVFTGYEHMVEIRPPRLIPELSGPKEVSSGDDFELMCQSDRPIQWFYPKLAMDIEEVQSKLLI
jgi:hypothetical protein